MKKRLLLSFALLFSLGLATSQAEDWRGFLGTDHDGTSEDSVPLEWSADNNIAWSADLPGRGNSSPIIVNGKVFLTCYTGYGLSRENPGDINELARHLLCFDAKSGKELWRKTVKARQPEDQFKGYIQEHGYASNTPVSDGEHVFVFMGKTGVLAFDMDGNEKWRSYVGGESNNKRWGSASAPVLYKNMVIVNASDEGQALCAFDKATGKELWRQEASTMTVVYAMPRFIEIDGRTDMVMRVSGEIWGMNPETGKLRWYAEHDYPGTTTATVQTDGKRLYTFGGFPKRATIALDLGGKGDLTNKIAWRQPSVQGTHRPQRRKNLRLAGSGRRQDHRLHAQQRRGGVRHQATTASSAPPRRFRTAACSCVRGAGCTASASSVRGRWKIEDSMRRLLDGATQGLRASTRPDPIGRDALRGKLHLFARTTGLQNARPLRPGDYARRTFRAGSGAAAILGQTREPLLRAVPLR